MDRFLNSRTEQKPSEFTTLGQVVCVLGKSGIGKTWAVRKAYPLALELTWNILKSKQDTINFLEKIQGSNVPVILDEYESVAELIGLKEITGPPTKNQFIITSQVIPNFDFKFTTYDFPVLTNLQMKLLVPMAKEIVIEESLGDIRKVIQSLNFSSDYWDDFCSPREFVNEIVTTNGTINPGDYIGACLQEPGNIVSIIHENYTNASEGKFRSEIVMEHLSTADIIDARIYAGDWDVLPFFNLHGCILPAIEIGHSLQGPLRPGSTWTKYQNMCMRVKKIRNMSQRTPGRNLSMDSIMLLRDYAEQGNADILREYNLEPADIDVLNHLSPYRKIKAKTVSLLKKCLVEKK
jgi:hypothetical protein